MFFLYFFTSVVDNITQSGVLAVGISDHLVIYCTRKVTRAKSGCHKCVKVRSPKKYTKDQFNPNLLELNCSGTRFLLFTQVSCIVYNSECVYILSV